VEEVHRIPVFVLAWERPIYLWVTLDSLFRHTKQPAEFVLIDNGSRNPLVREVIAGFERRGMFADIIFSPANDPHTFANVVANRMATLPGTFVLVEGDVEVQPSEPCWLSEFTALMGEHSDIGYLGSLIDASDFVDIEDAARIAPVGLGRDRVEALLKAHSPERAYPQDDPARLNLELQPPGRICIYRTEVVRRTPITTDGHFTAAVRRLGFKAGIANRVRHRHLSLLHVFDEPDYDTLARDAFFKAMHERG